MRWLRLPDLTQKLGLGKTSIYELIKTQDFPQPRLVRGLKNVSVWLESEVETWMVDAITTQGS